MSNNISAANNMAALAESITSAIIEDGWWSGFPSLPLDLLATRKQAIGILCQQGFLAGIGRKLSYTVERSIRGDRIAWLDEDRDGPLADWFSLVQELGSALRPNLLLPLSEVEMLVSRYARGANYERHVDQHRGVGARLLSVILYLNVQWQPDHGGCLHIFSDQGEHVLSPIAGRMVVMRADMAHAVSASQRSRYAITAWLRRPSIDGLL